MPRAHVPGASLSASSDALTLPWLAPRALAESPVLKRRQRCGGKSKAALRQQERAKHGTPSRYIDERPSCSHRVGTLRPSHPSLSNGASCRTPARTRASAPVDLRYADIASFAHRHARGYVTSAAYSDPDIHPESPQDTGITSNVLSGTRYSRWKSWQDQLDQQLVDLDPQQAGRRRIKYITQAEERLSRYHKQSQEDIESGQQELVYNGQYRSLRRLIISLKQYHALTVNVRKHTPVDTVDEEWLLNTFAALDRSVYAHTNALTKPVVLEHNPHCITGVQELLNGVDTDGGSRIFDNWHSSGKKKRKLYERHLIYLLDHKPGYAQDFIATLAEARELPRTRLPLLADALAYLARLHIRGEYPSEQGWEATPDANIRKFIDLFLHCTSCFDPEGVPRLYSQDLMYSIVQLAGISDLKRVYDALQRSHMILSAGSRLHYASAFGEAGEFRYALQVLEDNLAKFRDNQAWTKTPLVETERFRWTCATILRGSMHDVNNYHETPGIVAAFVEFGVKMDLLLYDVVMHNAMDAGDYATAFKVFNALEGHGLKPNGHTFSILLHGCATQNDPHKFKAFAEYCLKKAKELKDPWLATDFLYYTYICAHTKLFVTRNPTAIWRTYLDLFDLTPLQPFVPGGSRSMRDVIDEAATDTKEEKLVATSVALYLMLQTEIQTISTLNVSYLERLYQTFKRAISSDRAHQALTTMAQDPTIWNAFLLAFCRKMQYASASSVIKDMNAHGTTANVYSWNIFMQAFFKSGQVAAAELVFNLMRTRGVEPSAFTYGILVRGYAKAQLIDRVGETMQYLSEDDQLDPDLLQALSKVQNRADLTASLESNKLAKLRKDAEDAERKAKEEAERSERFESPRFKSLFAKAITFEEPTHWDNGGMEDADDFLEPDDEPSAVEIGAGGNEQDQDAAANVEARYDDPDDYLEPEDKPEPPVSALGHNEHRG